MKGMQKAVVTAVCSAAVVMMSVTDSSAQGRGSKGGGSNQGKQCWYNQDEGSAGGCSKATAGESSTAACSKGGDKGCGKCSKATAGESSTAACSKGGGKGCGKYRKTGTCSHVEQQGQDNSQAQGKGCGKAQKLFILR